MIYMLHIFTNRRNDNLAVLYAFLVHLRLMSAHFRSVGKIFQPDLQNCSLKLVHTTVYAVDLVMILDLAAVVPEQSYLLCDLVIVRDDSACISESAERFCGVKAEAAYITERSRKLSAESRAVALSAVLNKQQIMFLCYFRYFIHSAALSV